MEPTRRRALRNRRSSHNRHCGPYWEVCRRRRLVLGLATGHVYRLGGPPSNFVLNHHDALMLLTLSYGRASECPMPYPGYPSYMPDYPSPSTPQSFTWDLEHANQAQAIPQPQEAQELQAISPIAVFQHQLTPEVTTPQEQQQQQQHQQHQEPQQPQQQQQQQPSFDPPRVIELQERAAPSQFRFIDESHYADAQRSTLR